jgi:hypothetical protein
MVWQKSPRLVEQMNEKYYIEYEVEGFDGTHRAGPYPAHEVESQRFDIAGFEGVRYVRIVKAEQE